MNVVWCYRENEFHRVPSSAPNALMIVILLLFYYIIILILIIKIIILELIIILVSGKILRISSSK